MELRNQVASQAHFRCEYCLYSKSHSGFAHRGPIGALLIGDAEIVAKKILYVNQALGGISRITFQMGVSTLPREKMLRAIEILETKVAPMVHKELAAKPAIA